MQDLHVAPFHWRCQALHMLSDFGVLIPPNTKHKHDMIYGDQSCCASWSPGDFFSTKLVQNLPPSVDRYLFKVSVQWLMVYYPWELDSWKIPRLNHQRTHHTNHRFTTWETKDKRMEVQRPRCYIYIYINIKSSSHPTNTYQILHHLPQGIQVKIQAAWDNPNLVSPAHRGLELEPSWLFQPASLDGSTFISPVLFRIAIVLRSVGYTFDISWFLIWIPLMHMCLEFMCFFSACTVYHELSWIFAVWAYLSENHNPPHLPHGLPKVATSH